MKTKCLQANNEIDLAIAADILSEGNLVAVPTETVYGLAADASQPDAVNKIFVAKQRPANHPLIVHINSIENLKHWVTDIPNVAYKLAEKFWPGPLTLLFNKKPSVNSVVTGGLDSIAIRIPQSKSMLQILQYLDSGLAAPSANIHKKISPTTSSHVLSQLDGKIAAVVDGGACQVGVESTILDIRQKQYQILRHGPINQSMLQDYLGEEIIAKDLNNNQVPGAMLVHYQPHTKALLLTTEQINQFVLNQSSSSDKYVVLHYSDIINLAENFVGYKMPEDKIEYAKSLYRALHEVDSANYSKIIIEQPPACSDWADIMDRLTKACATNGARL